MRLLHPERRVQPVRSSICVGIGDASEGLPVGNGWVDFRQCFSKKCRSGLWEARAKVHFILLLLKVVTSFAGWTTEDLIIPENEKIALLKKKDKELLTSKLKLGLLRMLEFFVKRTKFGHWGRRTTWSYEKPQLFKNYPSNSR